MPFYSANNSVGWQRGSSGLGQFSWSLLGSLIHLWSAGDLWMICGWSHTSSWLLDETLVVFYIASSSTRLAQCCSHGGFRILIAAREDILRCVSTFQVHLINVPLPKQVKQPHLELGQDQTMQRHRYGKGNFSHFCKQSTTIWI